VHKPPLVDTGIELTQVEVNPRDPRVIYLGIDGGALTMSRDGGAHWTAPSSRPPLPTVEALAIDPRHPRTGSPPDGSRLYAGTTAYGRESGGGVFAARLR
jgi:hypothetical protein